MSAPEAAEPALAWVAVGRPEELTFDPGAAVRAGGRDLAVFRVAGSYVALDDSCSHAGGPLATGEVADGRVRCPWHGWAFDLATGRCSVPHGDPVPTWRTRLIGGVLHVELPIG